VTRSLLVVCCVAAVGCHDTPGVRERVLERLPGSARTIAVADGPALAAPTVRKAVDAVRPIVPTTLGCVIDAALESDGVGIAEDTNGIVVAVFGKATKCPALSQVSPGVWVATIGGLAPAPSREASVLAASRWERARTYLATSPIALALDLQDRHIVAAAQAEPLSAWLTIDSADPAHVPADTVRHFLDTWKGTPLEPKLAVTVVDRQLVVRAKTLGDAELATLTRELVAILAAPEPTPAATFTCPAANGVVVTCSGTRLLVRSIETLIHDLARVVDVPAIANAELVGVVVNTDAYGLRRGDIVLGIDGFRTTSAAELEARAKTPARHVTIAVRRGVTDLVLDVRQQE